MNQENVNGFVMRLQAKQQAGIELGMRERKYLEAVKRVKRRGVIKDDPS